MAFTFKHGDRPLDDFTIQRAVGRGGFGEVYYALSDGGREVALKYLRDNPDVELRGVSNCINLKSPHLVSIFDVRKSAEGEYFIVMEYVSGPSLRDLLVAEAAGLGPQKAAFFLRETAKGLSYLHDRGIVHRDLKPGNIFYDEGYVKIGDYGLSKFISISRHSAQTASVGTVHYMAPEVGSGNYHRGIDIYALGVILYEMLLGKVPFEGSSMGEVLMKHLTEQPEVDDLPAPFAKIIRKALQKDPRDRYQSVDEMVDDLLEVADVKSSLAGFNPISLSAAVRRPVAEPDSPAPSPNPAPGWRPRPAPASPRAARPVIDLDARNLPPRMAKRLSALNTRVERRLKKLDARHGRRGPATHKEPAARKQPPRRRPAPARTRGEIVQRVFLAIAMAMGLGLAVGTVFGGSPEAVLSAVLMVFAMGGGLAAGCQIMARLSRTAYQPDWVERIALAAPAAALLAVALLPLADTHSYPPMRLFGVFSLAPISVRLWGALAVTALLRRWKGVVREGAGGSLSFGAAVPAAIMALVLAAVFTHSGQYMFMAAGVAGAASLVLQALAWLFPLESWLEGNVEPADQDAATAAAVAEAPARAWSSPAADEAAPEGAAGEHAEQRAGTVEAKPFVEAERPRRWLITRLFGGLLFFASLIALVACIVQIAQPGHVNVVERTIHTTPGWTYTSVHVRTDPYLAAALAGFAAASFGLMLLGARKMSRYRTGGFYHDTLRPLLMAGILAALATSATGLFTGVPSDRPPFAVVLGASMVFFVLLLVFCGKCRRSRAAQRLARCKTGIRPPRRSCC